MDTSKSSRSRAERLFGIRHPLVYLGLSALWLATVVATFVLPGFTRSGASAFTVVLGVLALGMAAIAIVNIVMQRRGSWFAEQPAPLAQESDPRLRHTP